MTASVWVIAPLACLAGGAFAVYLAARLLRAPNGVLALLTAAVFAVALVALVVLSGVTTADGGPPDWGGMLLGDPGALVVASVAVGLGTLVSLYSGRYLSLDRRYETFYPLLLLLVAGLSGMVMANDLFSLYLFCELMSVSAYALVAFRRHTDTAIEAGFKYLVMGSTGTAILLLGISFVFRGAGSLSLAPGAIAGAEGVWVRVGMACFVVAFGVKSAIVPLHTWLPDAHGRAPSSISAMLSGIVIQSTLYAMLKTNLSIGFQARSLGSLLVVLAAVNMTLGNMLALVQTNTKRLLAYSTIAQTGYVMLGIGIGLRHGIATAVQAGFFMLIAHAAMKGLAFLCKGAYHFYVHATDIAQLRDAAQRIPLAAVAFGLALAGLAGVPPLAGFAGKWTMLTQILSAADLLVYAALVIFLINGLIALGYYLPLIGTVFSGLTQEGVESAWRSENRIRISLWMAFPLAVLGALVLAMGVYPDPWLAWTSGAGTYLLALGR